MEFPSSRHDPYAAAAELAAGVLATIRLAQGLVAADRAVDLAGLDGAVGLVCAKALDLAPACGRRLRPELIRLAEALEALDVVLHQRAPDGAAAA